MNKLKRYIVCEKEIGLEESDSWAIVEAKSEEEAFDLFVKRKGIYNKAFLYSLDMLLIDSFIVNRDKIIEEYNKELFNYLEGNKDWHSCILDICIDNKKRIYDKGAEALDSRISEDMLIFIYKKENTEAMLVLEIDEKSFLKI